MLLFLTKLVLVISWLDLNYTILYNRIDNSLNIANLTFGNKY